MLEQEPSRSDSIKQNPDVQKALDQATGAKSTARPAPKPADRFVLGTYLLVLLALAGFYYLTTLDVLTFAARFAPLLQRFTVGASLIVIVSAVAKLLDIYAIGHVEDTASRYNLRRILKLISGLIIAFIVVSVLFVNWYAPVISLGLISLILGFALQTPITSFIGWVYIVYRQPFRVGDRIKIGEATGDVIEVSYLDTTLWEFGGQYLSSDHPSGRIIKFPNSNVLSAPVYNYSWPLFPYIWNEIRFQVAYQSDLEFVAKTMREVVEKELGEEMLQRVRTFRELLAQTPVDELQVQERPVVLFRVSENTWIEPIVRYLVHPKQAGRVKTNLTRLVLAALNEQPGRVLFPKGDAR